MLVVSISVHTSKTTQTALNIETSVELFVGWQTSIQHQKMTQNRHLSCHHSTSGSICLAGGGAGHKQTRSTRQIKKKSVEATPRLFKALMLVVPVCVICLKAGFLFMDDICRIQLNACMESNYFSCGVKICQLGFFSPALHRSRHNQSVCSQLGGLHCCTEYVNWIDTDLFLTVGLVWG